MRTNFNGGFEYDQITEADRIPAARHNFFSDEYVIHIVPDLENLTQFLTAAHKKMDGCNIAGLETWLESASIAVDAQLYAAATIFTQELYATFRSQPKPNREIERRTLFEKVKNTPKGEVQLSEMLTNNLAQCAEVAALAQVFFQERGINAKYIAAVKADMPTPDAPALPIDHAFLTIEKEGITFIFDANNPLVDQNGRKVPSILKALENPTQQLTVVTDLTSGKQFVFGPNPKRGVFISDLKQSVQIQADESKYFMPPINGKAKPSANGAGKSEWIKK